MRANQVESMLWAGAAIALAYVVFKWQAGLKAGAEMVAQAYTGTRRALTDTIEQFFPLVNPNSLMTYRVTFPDGSVRMVPGETVDAQGFFLYNNARFRLMVSTGGQKIAITA